jgi:peptidoglycan/LPS O-acetylase OafA/YrhL
VTERAVARAQDPAGPAMRPHDLPLLDGLRAVAALMVVGTHVAFQTGAVVNGAWGAVLARFDFGVALFFVLSGFLLVRPWLAAVTAGRPGPSTRTYLLRRAARILPAYWLVLLVALLTTARGAGATAVLSNVGLLQVYTGDLLPGLTQTWSLCTEAAFYLVLPLVAAWLSVRVRSGQLRVRAVAAGLGGLVVVAWCWTGLAAGGVLPGRSSVWLPGHLDWFAVGIGLALVDRSVRDRPRSLLALRVAEAGRAPWTLLGLAGAVFWLACTPLGGPATLAAVAPATAVLKEALYAVTAGLVLAAVAFAPQRSGGLAQLLGNRVVASLGRISYGIFLWHLLVLAGVVNLLDVRLFTGSFWRVLALTVAGSVVVATASWLALERSVLAWAHRAPLTDRAPSTPGAAPGSPPPRAG